MRHLGRSRRARLLIGASAAAVLYIGGVAHAQEKAPITAGNFLRYIEDWSSGNAQLNYRGSIVSFFISRQATGTYKCCDNVYTAPARGYNFYVEFLDPSLLPPETPMFRDVNTLTFRQLLRPTQ